MDWLRRFLAYDHGIPNEDTLAWVMGRINVTAFSQCFAQWAASLVNEPAGAHEVIALDGKTARRSHNRGTGQKPLHVVSAWACEQQLSLGQLATEDQSNEITAIPVLLELLALRGALVTIDAMGCQRNIAQQIVEKEAGYVLLLKGNLGNDA